MPTSVLHFTFDGENILLSSLRVDSWLGFFTTGFCTVVVCFSERFVSWLAEERWTPSWVVSSRKTWQIALWRSGLFWVATFLRLMYMIIAMSQNVSILFLLATSLSVAEFFRELRACRDAREHPAIRRSSYSPLAEMDEERMLLTLPTNSTPANNSAVNRPRSKSKPEELFIHPLQSNVARADAAASQLGLTNNSSTTNSHGLSIHGEQQGAPWKAGSGQDAARQAFLSSTRKETSTFHIGGQSDSDSD